MEQPEEVQEEEESNEDVEEYPHPWEDYINGITDPAIPPDGYE